MDVYHTSLAFHEKQLYVTSQSPYGIQELRLSFVFSFIWTVWSCRKEKGRNCKIVEYKCLLVGRWESISQRSPKAPSRITMIENIRG